LRGRRRVGNDGSARVFSIRMVPSVALTFVLVGVTGYLLLEHKLAQRQIDGRAAAQRADARAFEFEGPALAARPRRSTTSTRSSTRSRAVPARSGRC
jgi:hypothetical protein